ncbi:unnamed protein product [Rotaria sp. Silwood1]|nr:unnamed protein product [Rotaria sp. Silwood1]CAF1008602.1 unnamed protein product [Rotaria sp. Silwood1]
MFLENAGGSQVPTSVINSTSTYYSRSYVQVGAGYEQSNEATHIVKAAHDFCSHERVNLDDLSALLSERTRIIAIPYVSNLIGEILDIESIVKLVRQKCPCARVIVDGVAYASHRAIDVYSSHIAVLYGSNVAWQELVDISAISNHFFIPQSDISYQYELGCLNHEACARILGVKSYFE